MRFTNSRRDGGTRQTLLRPNGGGSSAINSGFATTAQKAIDTLASAAADKSRNAIQVDSFEVNLFRYKIGNIPCTCKERIAPLPSPAKQNPYDTDLHIEDGRSPDYRMPTGIRTKAKLSVRPDGVADQHNAYKGDLKATKTQAPSTDVVMDSSVGDFPEEDFDSLPMYGAFPSLDDKKCGICGGTGFTDSYSWASGICYKLLPCDAITNSKVVVNKATRPHSIDISGPNSTQWLIQIPAYFEELTAWRVRDNFELEGQVRLTVDITGTGNGPWLPLSTTVFSPLQGVGGKVIVKATAVNAVNDDVTMFTHAELFLRQACRPRCQFPQLERDLSLSSIEAPINTQFEIDPAVGFMARQNLIEAIGQARVWFVTQISNKQTATGYLYNTSGQVQVVQPSMALYALAMYPRLAPINPVSWRGGLLTTAPDGLANEAEWPYDENETDSGNRL